jgi:hypothetical protein
MNSANIEKMKLNKLFLAPLTLSVLCFFLYGILSQPNEQGILQENFYLLLIGYGFLFLSVILLALAFFKQD